MPGITGHLTGSGIEILVTFGTPATFAASRASTRVPIVFAGVGGRVGLGVVSSLVRPGGNATGLALDSMELITIRLQLLQELVAHLTRLAVIVRSDPGLEQKLADIRGVAEARAIKVREFEAPTGRALDLAFIWLVNDRSDAIYVSSRPLGPAKGRDHRARCESSPARGLLVSAFPIAGGLMSFGADERDLFRRAAILVDKIIKRRRAIGTACPTAVQIPARDQYEGGEGAWRDGARVDTRPRGSGYRVTESVRLAVIGVAGEDDRLVGPQTSEIISALSPTEPRPNRGRPRSGSNHWITDLRAAAWRCRQATHRQR